MKIYITFAEYNEKYEGSIQWVCGLHRTYKKAQKFLSKLETEAIRCLEEEKFPIKKYQEIDPECPWLRSSEPPKYYITEYEVKR